MGDSVNVQNSKPGVDRLWTAGPGIIRGVIHGPLENKSNSKKIGKVRGRWMMFQGKEVADYIQKFEDAMWNSTGKISPLAEDARLYFKATVYQENLRRDLDCELLPDLLQKFSVIKNDRQIWRKEYQREIDKDRPRVEFEIGVIGEGAA